MSSRVRVRAPELVGRGWLNTDGPLTIGGLRGRFVLLDFWTFCCVNCLHVLDELRPVQRRWAEELVVIGVHSPKFVHEADPAALAAAVERCAVDHPVLDDPELTTWSAYTARAWPTLVLVDPEGYVVATYAGEGHAHAIDALLEELVAEHRSRGSLRPAGSPYVAPAVEPTDLRFPASALRLPSGSVLVADASHDDVVELTADGAVLRRFGGFREPNGLCLLPIEVAAEVGYDVVVADTGHHQLRGLDLASGEVSVLAGDGGQWLPGDGVERLSSPWDVVWWQAPGQPGRVWIAMAGNHQLWTFDPRDESMAVAGGTTNEGLLDGPLAEAWFAQTSGLAADGDRLWLVDAETSSLRYVSASPVVEERGTRVSKPPGLGSQPLPGGFETGARGAPSSTTGVGGGPVAEERGTSGGPVVEERALASVSKPPDSDGLVVTTVVGQGLFDFGFRDGAAAQALLQHPLGVTVLADGSVAVCDTYNGAVRRYDPATGEVTTVATDLAEPSGAFGHGSDLVVVESTAHRLTRVSLGASLRTDGFAHTTARPVTLVAADVELIVAFAPPPGQQVDDRFGPASQLVVEATPPALLRDGVGRDTALRRRLVLDPHVGEGVLHVAARAATCDSDGGEGAACRMHQQDWGVPVRIDPDGVPVLELPLGGAT